MERCNGFYSDTLPGLRKKAKLTVEELAGRLGVDRTTIMSWEKGRRSPGANYLRRLARVLGCKLDAVVPPENNGT